MKRTIAIALLALLPGASVPAASIDVQAERAALFLQDKAWAQAAAARDVDRVVSYWADQAHVFPPGQPVVVGKDALRSYVSEAFATPGFSISWETKDFVVSDSGDVAYGVSTNVVTMQDARGKRITEHGHAVTVWRKGPDGIWKCVVDMWNAAPAAAPSSE